MRLKNVRIQNFRALKDVELELAPGVNIIVGPNAVGKTTVLEAVRLAKAVLAPRSINESQQTLISLNAIVPHQPQQFIAENLAQNTLLPLDIRCSYELSIEEIAFIRNGKAALVTSLVRSRIQGLNNPETLAAFLSSPQGVAALEEAGKEIDQGVSQLEITSTCTLHLIISFISSQLSSPDPIGAAMIAFIEQSLPAGITKFSYFPADRALPRGETPIQLGFQDAQQQIESYNSQPQLKYGRLKNTIFNLIISDEEGHSRLKDEFTTIFGGVLRGRELAGAGVSETGQLSIRVKDKSSGRTFDIDGLSSGEKGLILTFLLISRTMSEGGIVLLDEPELHLNPAVCRNLIDFIVEHYSSRNSLQLLVCSHSPEILASAFGREDCSVFHLISESMITAVRRSDEEEISEILRRLGTSESEGLLYKATVFVEGPHDVEILEAGFASLLRQYKIRDLGGRNEVEKLIRKLQDAEQRGEEMSPRYFIFDKDRSPSGLLPSPKVRVLQWDRTCLENYLLDTEALTDLLRDENISEVKFRNLGETGSTLKRIAMEQLDSVVAHGVAQSFSVIPAGLSLSEALGGFSATADALFAKINRVRDSVCGIDADQWKSDFLKRCESEKMEAHPRWDAEWAIVCDGKRLFSSLQREIGLKIPLVQLKRKLISRMAMAHQSPGWTQLESLLKTLLS